MSNAAEPVIMGNPPALEALGVSKSFGAVAGQQEIVDRLGVRSPAVVMHEGLVALAGNGTRRYQQFQAQVSAFYREWRQFLEPRVNQGLAISEADLDAPPRFRSVEPGWRGLLGDPLQRRLGLLRAAALGALAARRALARHRVG